MKLNTKNFEAFMEAYGSCLKEQIEVDIATYPKKKDRFYKGDNGKEPDQRKILYGVRQAIRDRSFFDAESNDWLSVQRTCERLGIGKDRVSIMMFLYEEAA